MDITEKEEKLYECRYCYQKKMKSKGQICTICSKLFGKYVLNLNQLGEINGTSE